MNIDILLKRRIHRSGGRAVFNAGQPTRIAVGQDIDGSAAFLPRNVRNDGYSVLSDSPAIFHFKLGYVFGLCAGRIDPFSGGFYIANFVIDPVHPPEKIDRCGSGRF